MAEWNPILPSRSHQTLARERRRLSVAAAPCWLGWGNDGVRRRNNGQRHASSATRAAARGDAFEAAQAASHQREVAGARSRPLSVAGERFVVFDRPTPELDTEGCCSIELKLERYSTTPVKPIDDAGGSMGAGSDGFPSYTPPPGLAAPFPQSPYPSYTQPFDLDPPYYQTYTQPSSFDQGPNNQFNPARISPKNKRMGKAVKGVYRRWENYTHAEDIALCSAYLNVSKDLIVGVNQTIEPYWERIQQYFVHHGQEKWERSTNSLQKRYGTIQRDTFRFCSFKAQIDRKNQSGKSEDDRGLVIAAMYISNMWQRKDITTTLGTVKGKTLPSLDGTKYADDRRRHGGLQTEADLATKGVDPALRLCYGKGELYPKGHLLLLI
ncbi:hypothetical protein BAE44_0005589 [Dichanthelium oligosanthes]|uniref:No apical meristem-associated C-terminal domain-containing protein n=1 Tax=Dichanthelium oligosanthes TaxID=888268 RepID=A0A1E5W7J8_9POAL|nr:hypothetical protein BAE44_0005589 [Dichanthelium oligosanthes]